MSKKLKLETMTSTEMRFYEDDKKIGYPRQTTHRSLHRRTSYRCHVYLIICILIMVFYLFHTCGGEFVFFYNKMAGKYFNGAQNVNEKDIADKMMVYGYRFHENETELSSFVKDMGK